MAKPKIIMVCGSTATGKSKLANKLAENFSGEVVSADSMQIYKGLVIGTAAITPEEAGNIPQHLVGFLSPSNNFSVADYVKEADTTIAQVLQNNHTPILCGGTGQYLSAIQQGTIFSDEKPNELLRKNLQKDLQETSAEDMLKKLAIVDPEYASTRHIADEKRILRGLEQWELTKKTRKQRDIESHGESKYDIHCIGLCYEKRDTLYANINNRVDTMVANGLLEEAYTVFKHKSEYITAAQSIGYKEFFPYFEEEDSLEDCIEKLKQATRRYAKRQMTWFRSMPNIHWLQVDSQPNFEADAIQQVSLFLNN